METIDINKQILLLGIYDNLHDFLDCILFFVLKKNYFKLIDLIGLKNEILGDGTNLQINALYESIQKDSINELNIIQNIIKNFKGKSKNIIELRKKIIYNYKKIFGDKIKILDIDILKLRHLLYIFIEKEDLRESVLTIINNVLKNIDVNHVDFTLKELLIKLENLKKEPLYENLSYPISYFDDMTDGLNKDNYEYHIINLDKKLIDGARTMTPQKQLYKNMKEIIEEKKKKKSVEKKIPIDKIFLKRSNIEIKDQNVYSVGFTVKKGIAGDVLELFKTKYYSDNNKIICEFKDEIGDKIFFIQIGLLSNEIIFISKLIEQICQIFNDYWNLIKSKTFTELLNNEFDDLNDESGKKIDKLEFIRFITEIFDYISTKSQPLGFVDGDIKQEILIKNLCQGLVIYILTGAKRFGDWIQQKLSKKLYFMLQTNDYLCRAYGILIGAPVENSFQDLKEKKKIDESKVFIYNYNPSDEFISSFSIDSTYRKFGIKDNDAYNKSKKPFGEQTIMKRDLDIQDIVGSDKMIISTSQNKRIESDISRFWFKKYIKYKHKYFELKSRLYY
jgi:hypothetical protein